MSGATVDENTLGAASLPWQDTVWRQLHAAWRDGRWPHGLLLHGPDGVGKTALAERLTRSILCEAPATDWQACGRCGSCQLLKAGTHPDMRRIEPEEKKQSISIDQIREVCATLAMTSYRRGYKVTIISPAHQMTIAAANSLLKTLEEPATSTALILVTSRPGALLATLRSRCQQVAIRPPQPDQALSWLKRHASKTVSPQLLRFANGAPLRALQLAEGQFDALAKEIQTDIDTLLAGRQDVTHIAKRWSGDDLIERLRHLDYWLTERLREAIVGIDDPITGTPLPSAARQLNISRLYACLDKVRALQAQLSRTALQRELAADALLIELIDALSDRIAVRAS